MLKPDDIKTLDDVRTFVKEQAMHGPRRYAEPDANRMAAVAVEMFERNPDPLEKKISDFVRGWKTAEAEYES